MGGIGTGGVGRHIGDPVAFCAPPQPHRDSRATSTVWGHLRAVHQWETKTRPHGTPGCHHPTHLWPDAASPWRCGRGVLPALPPTPLPCMAAHPPAPSVPTVSPSWRSQRGEPSARERMEGGKVSGQPCWDPPTPPPAHPSLWAPSGCWHAWHQPGTGRAATQTPLPAWLGRPRSSAG